MSKDSAPPFAKNLASNGTYNLSNLPRYLYNIQEDKKIRDKAIKSLASFLADDTQEPVSKPDMDKLWKGIFYCAIRAQELLQRLIT